MARHIFFLLHSPLHPLCRDVLHFRLQKIANFAIAFERRAGRAFSFVQKSITIFTRFSFRQEFTVKSWRIDTLHIARGVYCLIWIIEQGKWAEATFLCLPTWCRLIVGHIQFGGGCGWFEVIRHRSGDNTDNFCKWIISMQPSDAIIIVHLFSGANLPFKVEKNRCFTVFPPHKIPTKCKRCYMWSKSAVYSLVAPLILFFAKVKITKFLARFVCLTRLRYHFLWSTRYITVHRCADGHNISCKCLHLMFCLIKIVRPVCDARQTTRTEDQW